MISVGNMNGIVPAYARYLYMGACTDNVALIDGLFNKIIGQMEAHMANNLHLYALCIGRNKYKSAREVRFVRYFYTQS